MPDLKEVIERLEGDAKFWRVQSVAIGHSAEQRSAFASMAEGLEHALSALKPLLEKNDG